MKWLDSTRAWANAIADLPAGTPLPMRTVLVPRERVAHALRRELVRAGKGEVLVGTRFVRAAVLASEVLEAAGVEWKPGEDSLRVARVHGLLRGGLKLKHFPLSLLQERPGWDEALARTISDLEAAWLSPAALPKDGAFRDVATIWNALDEAAGTSWTEARMLVEGAASLRAFPDLWRNGATLAALSGHEDAALLLFVRQIPGAQIALFAQDPRHDSFDARIAALVGADLPPTRRAAPCKTQRDVLASYLFAPPEVLAAPERPRIAERDGSVVLEEHAGVEDEVESAARWVAQRIGDGVALEDLAVLAPAADPWVSLVSARLARLDWPSGPMPVFVAGGLPLIETAAGARALALIRSLRPWLPIERVAALLPSLRTAEGHLSRGDAIGVVMSLGTVGGSGARPGGALEWAKRADAHLSKDPEHPVAPIADGLRALSAVAGVILQDGTLAEIVQALSTFADEHLLQPGMPAMPLLAQALSPLAQAVTLKGQDALAAVHDVLLGLRLPQGRFGEPAVYVGTVQGAVGINFRCVRIIGLAEGTIPSAAREDAVLPEADRRQLATPALHTPEERVLQQLHALQRIVRDTSDQVTLSASRVGPDGTQREPSSIFLQVLSALGSNRVDSHTLRREAFHPARRAAETAPLDAPASESSRLWRVARVGGPIPGQWLGTLATDPRRLRLMRSTDQWSPADGVLGAIPGRLLPGLSPERAISASRLQTLLECPHLFLFNHLGWREPRGLPSTGGLEPMTYGSLFHGTAEAFYREHGDAFSAHKRSLPHWKAAARKTAESSFADFAESWPLAGEAVAAQQRDRLQRDLETLLDYDWKLGPRTFVDVERVFGEPDALALRIDAEQVIYLRGRIDRLDVQGDRQLVRDLKTGRPKPRRDKEAGPTLGIDLQLAVYGLVAQQLAKEWGVPKKVDVAYVYPDGTGEHERAFREADFKELGEASKTWLSAAVGLLAEGAFPRTPVAKEDCRYCAFTAVCGSDLPARSLALLKGSDGALGEFLAIRVEPQEEEES
jgi:RecB family exonuclease